MNQEWSTNCQTYDCESETWDLTSLKENTWSTKENTRPHAKASLWNIFAEERKLINEMALLI